MKIEIIEKSEEQENLENITIEDTSENKENLSFAS